MSLRLGDNVFESLLANIKRPSFTVKPPKWSEMKIPGRRTRCTKTTSQEALTRRVLKRVGGNSNSKGTRRASQNRIVISASRTDTAAQLCDRSTLWGLGAHRIPVHCKQPPFILARARNDRVGLYCDQGCTSSDLSQPTPPRLREDGVSTIKRTPARYSPMTTRPLPGQDWTDNERAEIRRLEKVCDASEHWMVECTQTDVDDPWVYRLRPSAP